VLRVLPPGVAVCHGRPADHTARVDLCRQLSPAAVVDSAELDQWRLLLDRFVSNVPWLPVASTAVTASAALAYGKSLAGQRPKQSHRSVGWLGCTVRQRAWWTSTRRMALSPMSTCHKPERDSWSRPCCHSVIPTTLTFDVAATDYVREDTSHVK